MLIWIIDEEWRNYNIEEKELHETFDNVEIRYSNYDFMKDLEEFGYKADAILAQIYADITEDVINRLENCKVISVYGGGYDRVNVKAASKKGIRVTNVQKYCAEDVSDYVIAAMFFVNKKIGYYDSIVRDNLEKGIWDITKTVDLEHRLNESTLLIIGVGDIGSLVAKKALLLGMKVLGYDEYKSAKELNEIGVKKVDWDEGLKEADFISVHLRGTDSNINKINYSDFEKMNRNAFLINTSRGKVINEDDMVKAMNNGLIRGAILDVVTKEPPTGKEPVFKTKNIHITPHMSYITKESLNDLQYKTVHNSISVLLGEEPSNPVN